MNGWTEAQMKRRRDEMAKAYERTAKRIRTGKMDHVLFSRTKKEHDAWLADVDKLSLNLKKEGR